MSVDPFIYSLKGKISVPLTSEEFLLIAEHGDIALTSCLSTNVRPVADPEHSLVVDSKELVSVSIALKAFAKNIGNTRDASDGEVMVALERRLTEQGIIRLAGLLMSSLKQAQRWYALTALPSRKGKTPKELVQEGRAEDVEAFMRSPEMIDTL